MRSLNDILNIAKSRLEEAKILSHAGYYDGAFYLAGYSIELALKAKICKLLNISNLFDDNAMLNDLNSFKTHKISRLFLLSGLRKDFDLELSKNIPLYNNWNFIFTYWSEDCRYFVCGTKNKQDSLKLINAIDDPQNGVLTWILKN